MNYYTGIGARQTPANVLKEMTILAMGLEQYGYILRSGGAQGADTAFEDGVVDGDAHKEIYLPWAMFNQNHSDHHIIDPEAFSMAKHYHPAWHACSAAARKFHARNCYQILGRDLATPSDFVLCWTPNGAITGGTGQALRIAEDRDIPIFNLADTDFESSFNHYMTDALMGELQ